MNCCKTSFTICEHVPSCLDYIALTTPVISDNIYVKIIDKFNNIYSAHKLTDMFGNVQLYLKDLPLIPATADYPLGLLNEFAGPFKIIIYKDISTWTTTGTNVIIVPWVINGINVDALIINIKKETPNLSFSIIQPYIAEGVFGQFNL